MTSDRRVAGCLYRDTPANRARTQELFQDRHVLWEMWFVPYQGSAEGACENCDAAIWIGPEIRRSLSADPALTLMCMLCAAAWLRAEGAGIENVQVLTDKESGE